MSRLIGALDQGTTSTRFILFSEQGRVIGQHQLEHDQILPQPGWVEHDPLQILQRTRETIKQVLADSSVDPARIEALGITNQRETTILWNPKTGQPWYNAIVWQDTRTDRLIAELQQRGAAELILRKSGLQPATYFSGGKIAWLLDQIPKLRQACNRGEVLFGTIDTWLLWNLTGGPNGGLHCTDLTNASRTMLMDLEKLDWDAELLEIFRIPVEILPAIRPSSSLTGFGVTRRTGPFRREIPITGILGDQQAATVGQVCFSPGEAKNTYGTGNFMLLNTGSQIVRSGSGLLTTPCYQFRNEAPVYALEGSIAVTGSAVQWLRDQLGLIKSASEIETLASSVPNNGGVYFVPAFSGLFAPHWRSDARGVIVGLSRHSNRGHLARATLEAICYQTREVLDAMVKDSGVKLRLLKVDGGATVNDTLMQLQADILGVPVVRPKVTETTALGAAYAAGLAVGTWNSLQQLSTQWKADRLWRPQWSEDQRETGYLDWKKAVQRSLNWIDPEA